jgi:hypothetical protein
VGREMRVNEWEARMNRERIEVDRRGDSEYAKTRLISPIRHSPWRNRPRPNTSCFLFGQSRVRC